MIRNLLFGLLAVSGLTVAAPIHPEVKQSDFDFACEYVYIFHGVECGDLAPPKIIYSEFRSARTLWQPSTTMGGQYWAGSRYVYLNANGVTWATHDEIAFHESIHYIAYWTGMELDRCENEELARRATDTFMKRQYSPAWKRWYNC